MIYNTHVYSFKSVLFYWRDIIMLVFYETPEVEFVEMEKEEIVIASGSCPTYVYGDGCTGELAP